MEGLGGYKNVRRRKGGLKDMPNMPLDVVLEILHHLEPRDLLSLARTTKPFRRLLMNRGVASMWKAARANVPELPDCPPFLSEPAYANLCFSSYCHNCLKSGIQNILWEFCRRYCASCVKELTTAQERPLLQFDDNWESRRASEGLLNEVPTREGVLYLNAEIDELRSYWSKRDNDDAQWAEFVTQRKHLTKTTKEHAEQCRAWIRQQLKNRIAELDGIREQRLMTVVSKLRELGWGSELDRISEKNYMPLRELNHLRIAKPLTDRAWLAIQDDVQICMDQIRIDHHRGRRRAVLSARLQTLRSVVSAIRTAPPMRTVTDEYKPGVHDLAIMWEVRELLELPDADEDLDEQELADALIPMLPTLEQNWQRARREEYRALLAGHLNAADGVDVLELAAAVFRCKRCKRLTQYPVMLAHDCKEVPFMFENPVFFHSNYYRSIAETLDRCPLALSGFEVPQWGNYFTKLVKLFGMDPEATTLKDLEDADVRIVYRNRDIDVVELMTWRRMIKYVQDLKERNHGSSVKYWKAATRKDREMAHAVEVKRTEELRDLEVVASKYRLRWCCGHCDFSQRAPWASPLTLEELQAHVEEEHDIEDPSQENGDIYLHPESWLDVGLIKIK